MSRSRKRWLTLGAAALVAAGLGLVTLPAYAQTGTGTITGHLLDDGAPVVNTQVDVYDLGFNGVAQTTTDDTGGFTFADVAVGDYKIAFSLPGGSQQFAFGKLNDFDGADIITVTEGATTTVEETLIPHGAIAGRVTNPDGSAAEFAFVSAEPIDSGNFANATADADGNYTIAFVAAGTYRVGFSPNGSSLTQYANQKISVDQADQFEVRAGETTTLDQVFLPMGTIRGTFTDAGQPLPDTFVTADDPSTGAHASTFTDGDGQFQLPVWPGTYELQFSLPEGLSQYYHQRTDRRDADPIAVGAGADVVINEELLPTGTITGRLTDAQGNPVPDASVTVANARTEMVTTTDGNGEYQIRMFPGAYRVSFNAGFGTQWAFGQSRASEADPITVTAGASVRVDDTFAVPGSVAVTAQDATTAEPIMAFCAGIAGINDFLCTEDGTVSFPTVLPGRYAVDVFPQGEDYLSGFVRGVIVASGQNTAVHASVARIAWVSTKVVDALDGTPVPDACVEAVQLFSPSSLGAGGAVCADENGDVRIQTRPGVYNLFTWAPDGSDYGHQWVGLTAGTGTATTARLITTTAGQTVTVAPIKLDRAGTITGIITDTATAAPITHAAAGLASYSDGFGGTRAQVFTNADGRYTWTNLGPYKWVLFFRHFERAAQWSGGTPNRLLAAGVKVNSGQTTEYDQALRAGSTVSVKVLDANGGPVDFARITVVHALTGDLMGSGDCEGTARCVIPVLAPQLIKLEYVVLTAGEQYIGFHDGADDFLHADPVLVLSGTKNVTVTASQVFP